MRIFLMILVTSAGVLPACLNRANVQCEQDSNCDLNGGGVCTAAPTGNKWCAYPEPGCRSGYRYSTQAVGDGVSGACVAGVGTETDAGIDGLSIDAMPLAPPASCLALPHICGASRDDDCCHSIEVPGGTYFRSYDLVGDSLSGNTRFPATVSTFRLDKYEVTVGRFRAFVAAGQGTQVSPPIVGAGAHAKIPGSGWQASWNASLPTNSAAVVDGINHCGSFYASVETWTDTESNNENRPMTCLSWYQAMAFCIWDGGYLPTEAEWNNAVAGGDQQRAYAWSTPAQAVTIDGSRASYSDGTISNPNCIGDGLPGCAVTDFVPVGTKPLGDGRWGHSDLAGNVSEWLLDWSGYPAQCIDCANLLPSPTLSRLARGGSESDPAASLRIAADGGSAGPRTVGNIGVRCARAP